MLRSLLKKIAWKHSKSAKSGAPRNIGGRGSAMRSWKTQANLESDQVSTTESQAFPSEQFVDASFAIKVTLEPLLDCAGAAAVLGGLHPKTVERWAREGRIPAYHYFRHWKFRASELETGYILM
jgi:excisionase family DNA binding protein